MQMNVKPNKAEMVLSRAVEISLWVMVFALPFSISLLEIFFMCALVFWLIKRFVAYRHSEDRLKKGIAGLIRAFVPIKTELRFPLFIFVFIGFLSTLASVSLILSLKGFFFKLMEWVLIYTIVTETINDRKKLNNLLKVIIFSMVFIAVDALFQSATGVDFIRHHDAFVQTKPIVIDTFNRIRGPFKNPNGLAAWLLVMVPLALSRAFIEKGRWSIKIIMWVLTGALVVCLVLTYSRGAQIAAILSLALFGILKDRRFLVFIIVILLAFFFISSKPARERMGSLTNSIVKIEDLSLSFRLILWREAIAIIRDYPVLGCGLNTYTVTAPRYQLDRETGYYPHNCYLQMAAEMGIAGLAVFIWAVISLFKNSLAALKKIDDSFYKMILSGLMVGLFGFLAHSFIDTDIYALQLGTLMWFVMGLISSTRRMALADAGMKL
jgi:putative inorganic carbon (hco3(-)) transporter